MESPNITEITSFKDVAVAFLKSLPWHFFSISGKEIMRWSLYLIVNMEVI